MTERQTTTEMHSQQDIFGAALSNMPDNYLQCRDLKHPWEIKRNLHVVDANRDLDVQPRMGHAIFVQRLLECPRCGKKRSDAFVISSSSRWQGLRFLNSTYTDPPGFSVKGIGHMSGATEMVRGEVFRRIFSG